MNRRELSLRAPWLLDPEGSASVSVVVSDEWSPMQGASRLSFAVDLHAGRCRVGALASARRGAAVNG